MENAVDIVEEREAEIEIIERHSPIAIAPAADKPPIKNMHVRAPELHRNAAKVVMAIAALIGAAAGLRLSLGEANAATRQIIAEASAGTFGAVFLRQLAAGALFLAAELMLGFFAFGDFLVWSAPFLCTAGAAARLAATSPKQIPGTLIAIAAVTLGAAFSAEMSCLLLRLTSGGTVHTGDSPRREIALKFAGCLAAVLLAAILNASLRS